MLVPNSVAIPSPIGSQGCAEVVLLAPDKGRPVASSDFTVTGVSVYCAAQSVGTVPSQPMSSNKARVKEPGL